MGWFKIKIYIYAGLKINISNLQKTSIGGHTNPVKLFFRFQVFYGNQIIN